MSEKEREEFFRIFTLLVPLQKLDDVVWSGVAAEAFDAWIAFNDETIDSDSGEPRDLSTVI